MEETRAPLATRLPVGRLRLEFTPDAPLHLPAYAGSLWRGAFGWGLRRAVCDRREAECFACTLQPHCPFAWCFGRRSPNQDRFAAPPRPFVVEPSTQHGTIEPGAPFHVDLVLIGPALGWTATLIQGFRLGAAEGLGRDDVPATLQGVFAQTGPERWEPLGLQGPPTAAAAPTAPERVHIRLETPLRLKRQGRLVPPQALTGELFLDALATRLHLLSRFFGSETLTPPDRHAACRVIGTPDWLDLKRYSSSQESKLMMGGILGELELSGEALADWWPLLWLGQWLHVGGSATFGLGGYGMVGARPI